MLRPAVRCLAVMMAAVAAGIFARALTVYWMESIAAVPSEGMTCESPPEVVVGLPCFCPFVTIAGRGGVPQAALDGCRGLGQLGLRAC